MGSFFGEPSTSLVELGGQRDNPNVPSGYHFRPHDWELVRNYVKKKNRGLPLPVDIPAVNDLYGCHPKRLQGNGFRDKTDDNDHREYYFTRRKPKCGSKKKFKRSAPGEGFWKDTSTDLPIEDENKELIGYKRTLKFFVGKKKPTKWIMHEFRDLDECRIDRYVLCMIYQKGKRSPTTSPPSTPPINIGITGGIKGVGESPNSQYEKYMSSTLPFQPTEEWPLTESTADLWKRFLNPTPSVHNSTEGWPLNESIDDVCNEFLNPILIVQSDPELQECPFYVYPWRLW